MYQVRCLQLVYLKQDVYMYMYMSYVNGRAYSLSPSLPH